MVAITVVAEIDHEWGGTNEHGVFTVQLVSVGSPFSMKPGPSLPSGTEYVRVWILRDR